MMLDKTKEEIKVFLIRVKKIIYVIHFTGMIQGVTGFIVNMLLIDSYTPLTDHRSKQTSPVYSNTYTPLIESFMLTELEHQLCAHGALAVAYSALAPVIDSYRLLQS